MKKLFTLIAAAFMAAGLQAQTLTFEEEIAAGSANELTLGEEGGFQAVLNGGSKAKVQAKSLTYVPEGATSTDDSEKFSYQWCPGGAVKKTTGERSITLTVPSAGTLYIYSRSGDASATDRTLTVQQNSKDIVTKTISDEGYSYKVINGDKTSYYFYIVKCDVAAGTVNIVTNNTINFSAFKFVEGEGGGGEGGGEGGGGEGGETSDLPSYDAGTMVGNWSTVGTAKNDDNLQYEAKYNSNTTKVKTITFPNGATKDGVWQYAVKVEGEFKAGDKITIQPFTSMSADDYAGGTKYANILLYYEKDVEGTPTPKQITDMTGSAAGALTVTDGHEEAGDPKTFEYTLENDYTNLFFARGGNTRISIMKVTITRTTTGVEQVISRFVANDGVMYNLAGQKVGKDYKGVVIVNGKKAVMK